MQAAVAVAEGRVAAVVRGLYLVVAGLLLEVQVFVQLVAEAAVVGPSVDAGLRVEGDGGDH